MLHLPKDSRSRRRETHAKKPAFALGLAALGLLAAFALTYAADPPPNHPPVIDWFMISEGPAHTYEFFGYVTDPDNSTAGYVVQFGGTVDSYGISATVGADGSFDQVFILAGLQTGNVTADTKDPQGAPAETVAYWLQVTP